MNLESEHLVKGIFVIKNDRGLHTRPATEIVKQAMQFKSQVKIYYRKKEANAKSLLGILMLSAPKGSRIKVEAKGEDAEAAVASLIKLAGQKFNIQY